MFSVRYSTYYLAWLIYKDGKLYDSFPHDSEWAAIDTIKKYHSLEQGKELEKLHMSVD